MLWPDSVFDQVDGNGYRLHIKIAFQVIAQLKDILKGLSFLMNFFILLSVVAVHCPLISNYLNLINR